MGTLRAASVPLDAVPDGLTGAETLRRMQATYGGRPMTPKQAEDFGRRHRRKPVPIRPVYDPDAISMTPIPGWRAPR